MNKEAEEAMKRLERAQNDICYATLYSQEEQDKDIENVLNRVKELEKENKKLNKANQVYINSIRSITPVLLQDYIEKQVIRETIENEKINISGFECVAVEDLEKMLEGEKK